jgi:hypothetical protein
MNRAQLNCELQENLRDCASLVDAYRVLDDGGAHVAAQIQVDASLAIVVALDERGYTVLSELPPDAPPERTFETLSTLLQHHSDTYRQRMMTRLFGALAALQPDEP